ncbi:glycosyltransferase family 4 protein [Tateyamaria sp.]|uniref:glycosyltransferase family 4 protein n=1 Tax=Tateyamaria sp. TaxID=1929288 RepID=UPI00329CE398
MKITFLLLVAAPNGGTRVVATHAKQLLAMGHDVTVISRRPEPPSAKRRLRGAVTGRAPQTYSANWAVYLQDLGVRHVELPWQMPLSPDQVPDADVIIATWWRTAFEVAAMPPEKGAKVYFVQGHETFVPDTSDLAHGSYYLPLHKITVSDWLTRLMGDMYDDQCVTTVPNGVDTSLFSAPKRSQNTRRRVGFIYSPLSLKGSDVSLAAIRQCRQHFPDLELLVFGSREPTSTLPLPKGTTFHKLPDQALIPQLYASCDAWIFGSRYEGFGLPLLEAMACRTPVVATAAGAAPDLIENGVTGHVVPIEDAEAMAARLVNVLSLSNSDWQSMSNAAYDCAQKRSWDAASEAFEAALLRHIPTA